MGTIYIDDQPVFTGEIKTLEYKPDPKTFELGLFKKNFLSNMDFSTPIVFNAECEVNNAFIAKDVKDIKEPYTMSFNKTTTPKRKHHKTRIQKKWLKKYGFWTEEDVYKIKEFTPRMTADRIQTFDVSLEFVERRVY